MNNTPKIRILVAEDSPDTTRSVPATVKCLITFGGAFSEVKRMLST